jgi:hypothetical protein
MADDDNELKKQWPAVDAAFAFVLPSYQMMVNRFEAADTRLTALLTIAATLTTATPILAKNVRPDISFGSPFLWAGVACFAALLIVGLVGRIRGAIVLPDPTVLYEKSLHRSEWSFKMTQISFAGENFRANQEAIRKKGDVATCITVGLGLEVIAFIAWLGI